MEIAKKLASYLLQSKAIIIDPATPFTWSSGWKSPIYCDTRKTLSYPEIRTFVRDALVDHIHKYFTLPDMIAGVATGAIAHASLVADQLGLPFIYVRSSKKSHGTGNLIEGDPSRGSKVVIIEDLISTGGSSLKAAGVLREAGIEPIGMLAVFTYGFPVATENFRLAGVLLRTLCDYETLISEALRTGYIPSESLGSLSHWRKDPGNWKP